MLAIHVTQLYCTSLLCFGVAETYLRGPHSYAHAGPSAVFPIIPERHSTKHAYPARAAQGRTRMCYSAEKAAALRTVAHGGMQAASQGTQA